MNDQQGMCQKIGPIDDSTQSHVVIRLILATDFLLDLLSRTTIARA